MAKRMRRAYLKGFTRSNPQNVNWVRVGGRPRLTDVETPPPKAEKFTLENLDFWQGFQDQHGQLPTSCPPRIATLIRYREIMQSDFVQGVQTYYSTNFINTAEKQLDLMFAGRWFWWIEINHTTKLIARSIKYPSRDDAMNGFPDHILWTELKPFQR